ncbi:MAG: DUF5657 family protein [Patescibacteria group bacterium]
MNTNVPFDQLLLPFLNVSTGVTLFWDVIGLMLLIGFFVYALFALIVIRQVFLMASTFKTTAGIVLKMFSFVHFFFAVSMIIFAFIVLF